MWDKGHQLYPRIKSSKRHPQPICCSVETFIALIFLLLLSNISVIHIHLKTPQGRQERGEGSKDFPARNFTLEAPIPPNAPEPQHAHLYFPVYTLADRLVQTWSTTSPWETAHALRLPDICSALRDNVIKHCGNKHWEEHQLWDCTCTHRKTCPLLAALSTVKGDGKDTGWTMACFPLCSVFAAMSMLKENHFDEQMSRHQLVPHASCFFLWSNAPEDPLFICQLNLS